MQPKGPKKILSLFLIFSSLPAFSQNGQSASLRKKLSAPADDSIRRGIQLEKEKGIALYRRLLERGLVTREHFEEVVAMREKIASEKLANNTKSLDMEGGPNGKSRPKTDKESKGLETAPTSNADMPANNTGQPCNCVTDFSGPQEKDAYWYHPDHLGSSSFVTGPDGEVNQNIEYFPSGEVFVENHRNSYDTPYKFNGKELDDETSYYYYGARYYNPRVSLWLNVDPLAEKYPSLSPYVYVADNPTNAIDPDGSYIIFLAKDGQQLVYSKGNFYYANVHRDSNRNFIVENSWRKYNGQTDRVSKNLFIIARTFRQIEKSKDKILKGQLHTLENSDKMHFIRDTNSNDINRNAVDDSKFKVAGDENNLNVGKRDTDPKHTMTNFDFGEKDLGNGEQATPETTVIHEMRHIYDYDQGNMGDKNDGIDQNDPAEIRAVYNENLWRKSHGIPSRKYYGGKINEKKLNSPPNNKNP